MFKKGDKVVVKRIGPLSTRYKIGDLATYVGYGTFEMYDGAIQSNSGGFCFKLTDKRFQTSSTKLDDVVDDIIFNL